MLFIQHSPTRQPIYWPSLDAATLRGSCLPLRTTPTHRLRPTGPSCRFRYLDGVHSNPRTPVTLAVLYPPSNARRLAQTTRTDDSFNRITGGAYDQPHARKSTAAYIIVNARDHLLILQVFFISGSHLLFQVLLQDRHK